MANNLWVGNAVDIYQEDTITIDGTWAATDSQTLTINGNDLVVTLVSSTNTASVATIISNAINATSRTDNLENDETRNIGGQEIPEFTELEASVSGSVVTVNGVTPGVPYTLTKAAPSSSSGTSTLASVVSCTGKHFFDNVDNWSEGAVPATGDKIIFQQNSVDCSYNLDQNASSNSTLQIDASYTGRIGLPIRNPNGYNEYRPTHLSLQTSTIERAVVIGEGPGSGSRVIRLDVNSAASCNAVIASTGVRDANEKATVDFIGTLGSLTIQRGSLSMAAESTNTAAINTLEIGQDGQNDTNAEVYVGDNTSVTTVTKTGGYLEFINGTGTVTAITNHNGTALLNGTLAVTTLNVNGGHVIYNSTGALGTAYLRRDGWLDFSQDNRAKTVTNEIERYDDRSRVSDPAKVVASLAVHNNGISDMSRLEFGLDSKITRGTI